MLPRKHIHHANFCVSISNTFQDRGLDVTHGTLAAVKCDENRKRPVIYGIHGHNRRPGFTEEVVVWPEETSIAFEKITYKISRNTVTGLRVSQCM